MSVNKEERGMYVVSRELYHKNKEGKKGDITERENQVLSVVSVYVRRRSKSCIEKRKMSWKIKKKKR